MDALLAAVGVTLWLVGCIAGGVRLALWLIFPRPIVIETIQTRRPEPGQPPESLLKGDE